MAKENVFKLEDSYEDIDEPVVYIIQKKSEDAVFSRQVVNCNRCGQSHKNRCLAEGAKCHKCGNIGHFSKICFTKKRFVRNVNVEHDGEYDNSEEKNKIYLLEHSSEQLQ